MNLQEKYLQKYILIHTSFGNVCDAIRYINTNFPVFAKTHFDSKNDELLSYRKQLQSEDPETSKTVEKLLQSLSAGEQPQLDDLSKKSLDAWLHNLEAGANYQYSVILIHEMLLVDLITKFNEFLKDTLKIAFSIDPQTKDSWKTMSLEKQETQVFHFVEDDIKEMAIKIRKFFKLDLKQETDWKDFAEYTYRRHVFIHNRGFPSDKYKKRTGYSGPETKLSIDKNYVEKGIILFKRYSDLIEEFFIEKHLDMVNITKKSNIIKIDLTKGGGTITPTS